VIRQSSEPLPPRRILGIVLAAASALVLLAPSPSSAYPPTPPSAGEAAVMLEGLSVEAEGLPKRLQPRSVPALDHSDR